MTDSRIVHTPSGCEALGPCTQAELDEWEKTKDTKTGRILLMWMERALKAEEALAAPPASEGALPEWRDHAEQLEALTGDGNDTFSLALRAIVEILEQAERNTAIPPATEGTRAAYWERVRHAEAFGPCTQAELDEWEKIKDSKTGRILLMWQDRALKAEDALADAPAGAVREIADEMVENGCRGMYGKHWDGPADKQPGELMKKVWRKYSRNCLEGALALAHAPGDETAGLREAVEPGDVTRHATNCGWDGAESNCTCCLKYRVALSTEQEMHRAWRKRAEEAETALAARPADAPAGAVREALKSIMALDPETWIGEAQKIATLAFWESSEAHALPSSARVGERDAIIEECVQAALSYHETLANPMMRANAKAFGESIAEAIRGLMHPRPERLGTDGEGESQ